MRHRESLRGKKNSSGGTGLENVRIESAVLIAEACRFYGWTDEHCLEMPAARFYAMLEAGRKLKARENAAACVISRCSAVTYDGFVEIVKSFEKVGPTELPPKPEKPKNTMAPTDPVTKASMINAFAWNPQIRRKSHLVKH